MEGLLQAPLFMCGSTGGTPGNLLMDPKNFDAIYVIFNIWQNLSIRSYRSIS